MGQYLNMRTKGASRLANPPPPPPRQETQPQWLWRLDPSTRLIWVNQDCRRFFTDHLQQLPDGPQPLPVHKEDLHRMRTILRSLSPVAPVANGVFRLQMPNGAVRWQRWIAHAAFSDLGRITDYWLMADQPTEAVAPPKSRYGGPYPFEGPGDDHSEEINEQLERWKQEYTVEQCRTAEMMKQKQAEVLRHKLDLKRVNKELIQTNRALSVLARNINLKQRDYVKRITESIGTKLLPAIDALEKEEISENCRVQLEMIRAYLVNLNPEAVKVRSVIASLSSVELRLAVMIKNGLSSSEIASLLNLSEHTVKTHRRSIRRKLGICNSKFNLSSFLKLRLGRSHSLAPTETDRSETEFPLKLHQISA
jgi:DNA-binding CsgD family transcriptional regulator